MDMDKDITHITLGIRHRRTFGLAQKAGDIVDHVLYDPDSPFNTNFFPNYFETASGGRMVGNEETGESFAVDSDSVVLRLVVKNFDKGYLDFKNIHLPYINKVFTVFGIENINRIGIVFEHNLRSAPTIDKVISAFTSGEVQEPNTFSFKFAKKYPTIESHAKKDIVDYYNAICSFETQNGFLVAKLDYQAYFDPEYKSINDIDFNSFLIRAEKYLHTKFQGFLAHEKS